MSKRILSLVLAFVMVLGTFGTVFAAEPTGNSKVDWLVEQGYVLGDAGGLRLEDGITRAEVSVLVSKALGLEAEAAAMSNIPSKFSDMRTAGTAWANGFVNVLNGNGYISGYPDGTFGPAKDITYAEVASMLVRVMGGLTEEEAKNAVWPTTYLTKAASLGIFEDVTGVDYTAKAVRGKIFEMVYNTLDKEVGTNTVVKAIVLENNRVETIAKDEVVVEILKVEQVANYAKESRVEKGQQISYVIDAKLGNVENLLGQVANFTINKDGKVIKITPDTSYKVVSGPATATKNKIKVGSTSYTVELDERYKGTDERVFRTYHNDTAYSYEDFYQDPATIKERNRKSEFAVDYARVTVKNGKVLLIDSFSFDDIAPVQEVKRDGLDVYVYNDYRDARVEKFEPRALVVAYNNGKFSRIERTDIKANDVVHVYKTNRMIVRQDALVEGTYQKVERDRYNDYYAHIDDNAYYMADANYRRPVYAHDSKAYTTLYATDASRALAEFYKEEVIALLDINGDLQLFGADIEYNEGMAIVDQILARGQGKFVQSNDEKLILDEDYTSKISTYNLGTGKTTTNQRLNSFDRGDLTFVVGNEDKIGSLVRVTDVKNIRDNATAVAPNPLNARSWDMNNSYIKMASQDTEGVSRYQVLDRTNVFVMNVVTGTYEVKSIAGSTVADVVKNSKAGNTVKAFVITDKQVSALADTINNRNRITDKNDIAHTIIFLDTGVNYAFDGETILVSNVYTARTPHYVAGRLADSEGRTAIERTAISTKSLRDLKTEDIVQLQLTKNDDKLVQDYKVLIAADKVKTDSYKVVDGDFRYSSSEYRRLVLEDAKGAKQTLWLTRDVKEFGTLTLDSVVTFDTDTNGDIYVLRVYGRNTPVTASGGYNVTTDGVVNYVSGSDKTDLVIQVTDNNGNFRRYDATKGEISLAVADFLALGTGINFEGAGMTFNFDSKGNINGIKSIKLANNESIATIPAGFDGLAIDGNGKVLSTGLTIAAKDVTITKATINGNLTVNVNGDNFTSKENVITGNVVVNGKNANFNTEIGGDVTVNGTATFKNVEFSGDVTVNGAGTATIENVKFVATSTLTVDGKATIVGTTTGLLATNVTGTGTLDASEAKDATIKAKTTDAIDKGTVTKATYDENNKLVVSFTVKDTKGNDVILFTEGKVNVKVQMNGAYKVVEGTVYEGPSLYKFISTDPVVGLTNMNDVQNIVVEVTKDGKTITLVKDSNWNK